MRIINRLQNKRKKRVLNKKFQINKKNSGISFPKKIFIRRYIKTKRKSWLRKRGIRRKNYFKKKNNFRRASKKKKYVFFSKRYWHWIKKKKHKKHRSFYNFMTFFLKKFKKRKKLIRSWYMTQKKWRKLNPKGILESYINWKSKPSRRRSTRLKRSGLKKRLLKYFLLNFYNLGSMRNLKKCYFNIKKWKNKLKGLIFNFECKLAPCTLRFHFFWRLRRAYFWVSSGVVSVNNVIIQYPISKIFINDFIKLMFNRTFWLGNFITKYGLYKIHSRIYRALNYLEFDMLNLSGIVLLIPSSLTQIKVKIRKRKKYLIKFKLYQYLINSFY